MSMRVAPLLAQLVDDAAVFPPGSAPLAEAVRAHRVHRAAWYAPLVGPLLLPASQLNQVPALLDDAETIAIGVIGDTGVVGITDALAKANPRLHIRQVEVAVAKRGEDPQPGLAALLDQLAHHPEQCGYAELPLTWGLFAALDTVAKARAAGVSVAPKFRTGGLAAELFPTPAELAGVICACRDRTLPFKLTAGLHHAIRHIDAQTGFAHHGFLNILAGTLAAARGADVAEVTELLACTDPQSVVASTRPQLSQERPLWIGFGTCSIAEPLDDLRRLGLLDGDE